MPNPQVLAALCTEAAGCLHSGQWSFTSRTLPKTQIASQAIQQLLEHTPTLDRLCHRITQRAPWPVNAQVLSRVLHKSQESLEQNGILMVFKMAAGGHTRQISISRIPPDSVGPDSVGRTPSSAPDPRSGPRFPTTLHGP